MRVKVRYLGVQDPHVLSLPFLSGRVKFIGGEGSETEMEQEEALRLRMEAPNSYEIVGFVKKKPKPAKVVVEKEKEDFDDDIIIYSEDEEQSSRDTLTRTERIFELREQLTSLGIKIPRGRNTVKNLTKLLEQSKKKNKTKKRQKGKKS